MTADISDPQNISSVASAIGASITPYTASSGTTDMGEAYYSTPTSNSAVAYYEMIFVPQTIAAGELGMSITLGDIKANWTSPSSYTFEGGNIYIISLSLSVALDGESGGDSTDQSVSQLQFTSFVVGNDWYSGESLVLEAEKIE